MGDEEDKSGNVLDVAAKKLVKTLSKRDGDDLYEDSGNLDNPYWSDVSDDEDDVKKIEKNIQQKPASFSEITGKPASFAEITGMESKPEPKPEDHPTKRQRLENSATPPPPSASEVIRQIEKKRRQQISASPAASSSNSLIEPTVGDPG